MSEERIIIIGGPRSGKTTTHGPAAAARLGCDLRSTDEVNDLPGSEASAPLDKNRWPKASTRFGPRLPKRLGCVECASSRCRALGPPRPIVLPAFMPRESPRRAAPANAL